MKIAFIHYHLKTGGVTTVVRQQVETVSDECEVLVLTGELPKSPFPAEVTQIPGLGYYDGKISKKGFDHKEVAESVIRAITSKWKEGCDILHVHNPTLAKNRNFLKILRVLHDEKIRLFLQIHDFAEDGRPLFYSPDEYIPDCHYGVVNSRDYDILLKAGLKEEGLHKIFNPVKPFAFKQKRIHSKEYVLYPVRAIRRKNIGEAILLSLFFNNQEALVITLPPHSQLDIESYAGWKKFSASKNLNVEFEAGLKSDFADLVLSAKLIITTSITEGFGFSFLEPWTAKKILWGRKLAGICRDFEENGIRLDHLYTRLLVPVEWIGKEELYKKRRLSVLRCHALFNRIIDEDRIVKFFAKRVENDNVDFGLLDEAFQKKVISRVLSSRDDKERLIYLNPYLLHPLNVSNSEELIRNNLNAVLNSYNKTVYRKRLLEIYSKVIKSPVSQRIDKNTLLSEFLNPDEFNLLKWGYYAE